MRSAPGSSSSTSTGAGRRRRTRPPCRGARCDRRRARSPSPPGSRSGSWQARAATSNLAHRRPSRIAPPRPARRRASRSTSTMPRSNVGRRAIDGQQLATSQVGFGGKRRHDDAVKTDLGDGSREGDDLVRSPITGRPHVGAGDRDRHLTGDVDRIEVDPAPSVRIRWRHATSVASPPAVPTVTSVIGEKSPVG